MDGRWAESSHEMGAMEPEPDGTLLCFYGSHVTVCPHSALTIAGFSSGPELILVHAELL